MSRAASLVQECKRLSESCLYTSTALFIWLRSRRRIKAAFVTAPLVLGSLASWRLLTEADLESAKVLISVLSFIAGVLPSIYSALKFDDELKAAERSAAEFKNLQDRFRQAALVAAHKSFAEFETEFRQVMGRLEEARKVSLTPPERLFKAAQAKIKSGDYDFDVDTPAQSDGA